MDTSMSTICETRRLRVAETANSEERKLPVPPPSFTLFANLAKTLRLKITSIIKARYWLWRKKSAEDVYKQLKLDGGLDNIFDNPKMATWSIYVRLLNKKNPNNQVSMAKILINSYGDLPVAILLQNIKATQNVPRLASRLRGEQNILWKSSGKSADDVFVLLKLDKVRDDIFVRPQLNAWYNYVSWLERGNAKTVMASVLLKHYKEETLSKMFQEARPVTRRMRFVRMWLETAVDMNRLSPEGYFKLLKLDAGVDKLLTNSNLVRWIEFLKRFNVRNPGKQTTVTTIFTKFYGDEALAKMLESARKVSQTKETATLIQAEQFSQWLRDGIKPESIQKMLKVETATDPYTAIWRRYEAYYLSKAPKD